MVQQKSQFFFAEIFLYTRDFSERFLYTRDFSERMSEKFLLLSLRLCISNAPLSLEYCDRIFPSPGDRIFM